ncbi:hypothetical protein [Thiohalomonas denitrificans]|uniref:hypothetical protein n=1 Tax=Thiohalomonas denitrificans TaxID=415747 RepID=UPI0026EB3086|nr:hypothetical protein [Thiohalomonas denitrificans]
MKTSLLIPILSLVLLLPVPATAQSETGEQAIRDLGALNGMALECGYVEQVRRMKKAMIDFAPKSRHYGSVFEQSTNRGFLSFIKEKRPCPTEVTVEAKVDKAVESLEKAFQ